MHCQIVKVGRENGGLEGNKSALGLDLVKILLQNSPNSLLINPKALLNIGE
jgi:hypothetical protein